MPTAGLKISYALSITHLLLEIQLLLRVAAFMSAAKG